jgi:ribonuclease BN (tRNA processing enzyme)
VIDGQPHVIDCGSGVARQLVFAGVPLHTLARVFVTHHHSDHNADFGNLFLLAWMSGLRTPVDAYGPPPIDHMRDAFLDLNAYDIGVRTRDEMRPQLRDLFRVHELQQPGVVLETDAVRVTSTLVRHPPVEPAFAFRFDTPSRSIIVSGDTTYSPELIELARGADVLVHEAMYLPGIHAMAARVPNAQRLVAHLEASHTPVEDVGRVAAAAGVRTLVLSHLAPADDPSITDEMWLAGARATFDGEIIVGRDLQVV